MTPREKEAWRLFHREEASTKRFYKSLESIRLTLEGLELDMEDSLVRQYSADKGFLAVLRRFNGHTQYGWECACGPDGRIRKLGRDLGWPKMRRIIWRIRQMKDIWPAR